MSAGHAYVWGCPKPGGFLMSDCIVELASVDSESYCAGPVIHPELADPTRPGEIVVGYQIGSTAANQGALMSANPRADWPRLAWVTAP